MKLKKNKKILLIIFSMLLLSITSFCIAINKKGNVFYNLVHKQEKLADDEIELDNWEISTVFYDSTVNNGNTPLTEINWDVPTSQTEIDSRTIKIQINYKNTNTVQDYNPGDLKITIPNLIRSYCSQSTIGGEIIIIEEGLCNKNLSSSPATASANDSTHSGYDWNVNGLNNNTTEIKFTNNIKIEQNSNFEGTIQIIYNMSSYWENPTEIINEKTIEFNKTLHATLNDSIEGNEIVFNYKREYKYDWKKAEYNVILTPERIQSYDRLGNNPDDYIWVKYTVKSKISNYNINHFLRSTYPYIRIVDFDYEVFVPNDCIVYNEQGEKLETNESKLIINASNTKGLTYEGSKINGTYVYYMGYPKDEYASQTINANVVMTGKYNLEDDKDFLNEDNKTIELDKYMYTFTGELYSLKKTALTEQDSSVYYSTSKDLIYQNIIENNGRNYINWVNTLNIKYTGTPLNVTIGDDYIFVTDNDNNLVELGDDDYYFRNIYISSFYNSSNTYIEPKTYQMHLYVRYAGEDEYTKYKSMMNGSVLVEFSSEEKVVDWYLEIENLKEGLKDLRVESTMMFVKKNINQTGNLINYSYMKIFDNNNNLLNTVSNTSYDSFTMCDYLLSKENPIQRAQASKKWSYYVPYVNGKQTVISKNVSSITQDAENEVFTGTYIISGGFRTGQTDTHLSEKELISNFFTDNLFFTNLQFYDLLPKGIILDETEQSIIDKILVSPSLFYNKEGDKVLTSLNEATNFFKERATIKLTDNWRGTGRTLVKISFDFSDMPLIYLGPPKCTNSCAYAGYSLPLHMRINFKVPYDSYLENNGKFINYAYVQSLDGESNTAFYDNGSLDSDAVDITEDGYTTDMLRNSKIELNISSNISSHQDVQTSIQTDKSNFVTGKVETSPNKEYIYKLRVRTGQNNIKNLVIYDSLEDYAKNSNQEFINANGAKGHWQGEFLGVDTSYAESKGYNVKVYYSESAQPGSLKEDTSWKEYTDSVDKTKVKSLAFEYLDEHGNPAIVPANSLTYVLINMKSPSEEFKTFAYNGCWTEWNAIDPITNQSVDFITGINSNIVRVALPSSVEPEDIELTLTKKWIDNANSLNKRPKNVPFRIIPNDDYSKATEVTFSGTGNTWSYNVTVPKYDDDGEEIEYTIKEDTINLEENYKYVPSVDNYEVTNTLYKNLIITKNWLDNNNAYLTRPSNITVKVYQNGNYYKDLNITGDYSTNTWTGSLSVPVFDDNGTEYVYTVDEISVDNYNTSCENLVCTNLLTDDYKITITKEWLDDNNSQNTRPSSITVKLKQNGDDYQDVTLIGNDNTWTSDEITVPMYDDNGIKYTYTIEEGTIEHYGLVSYDQENFKVTNTLKETSLLTITKKWLDKDNEYGTRPDSLSITLLQNDTEYQTITLSGDTSTWTTTIEVPKYDDNQKEYTYSIKEINDNLEDYQDITYSDDELSVTNKLKKNINLKVTKEWIDHDNEYQTRPSKITVKLLQDGEEYQDLELSGDGNTWETSIEVPVYDNDSNKHIYTIKELDPLDNYKKITYDQTTYTITNELTDIPKVTVYFTVLNGYVEPGTNEIKYDEEGFRETLRKHGIDPDSDYEFTFELQNIETNKIYEGKLSTKGVLQFEDIPYGDYRALEGNDDIFEFVSMESIGEVLGVKFTPGKNGGIISIRPTGQDIIYGANITNKVSAPIKNPNTGASKIILISLLLMVLSLVIILFVIKKYPKLIKGHVN